MYFSTPDNDLATSGNCNICRRMSIAFVPGVGLYIANATDCVFTVSGKFSIINNRC